MSLSRRQVLQAALLPVASFAAPHAWAQAGPKVIRAVPIGDLKVLDPIWTTAYITRNHGYLVWDTLFALDAENRPQPQMVERHEVSADGKSYTFQLRPGLLWHDGTPVRAADCVASIRRWGKKDGMGRALLDSTDRIEAADDASFRIVLKQPVGFVIDALAKIDSNVPFMMPERLALTQADKQITEAIGSGPFRFVAAEWVPGVKVVYERFKEYRPRPEPPSQAAGGKVAKVDRVELVYTPDSATAAAGLEKGEFDLLENPAPDLVPMLQRAADVTVRPNDPLGYQLFIVLNHLQPPFSQKKARQALLTAVSQPEFMLATVGDKTPWRECAAAFGCASSGGSSAEELGWPKRDLEKAKQLLQESGYAGEKVVILDPADNATLHPGALVAAETLRRIGAKVDVQAMDWSTLIQRRASKAPPDHGGWNLFVTNATVTGISNPLLDTFAKNCEEAWYGWPCDRKAADLTRAWALETNPAKRKEITLALERLVLDEVTLIPLGQYQSVIAYRKDLRGIIPGPALFYWNVSKG